MVMSGMMIPGIRTASSDLSQMEMPVVEISKISRCTVFFVKDVQTRRTRAARFACGIPQNLRFEALYQILCGGYHDLSAGPLCFSYMQEQFPE